MNTFYQSLVAETQNWEDFVLEGGGTLGCCGVNPTLYGSQSACASACITACPSPKGSWKPLGCTKSVPTAKATCCFDCCGFNIPACKGASAFGSAACGPGGGGFDVTTVKMFCHNAPSPRTTTLVTGPFKNKIIRTNVGCVP